jgi:hypothetical protein
MKLLKVRQLLRERLGRKDEMNKESLKSDQPSECESLVLSASMRTNFEELPAEIIRYIGSFLPDPFEACLALSSKSFLLTLGSQSMERMHESRTANDVYTFPHPSQ